MYLIRGVLVPLPFANGARSESEAKSGTNKITQSTIQAVSASDLIMNEER